MLSTYAAAYYLSEWIRDATSYGDEEVSQIEDIVKSDLVNDSNVHCNENHVLEWVPLKTYHSHIEKTNSYQVSKAELSEIKGNFCFIKYGVILAH